MWRYKAQFVKAVDGDTVDLVVDLGFKIYAKIRVRLLGVDTPERGQDGYNEATEFVKTWFECHEGECVVETKKTGKYGRWLATIMDPELYEAMQDDRWHEGGVAVLENDPILNEALIEHGFGVPYG